MRYYICMRLRILSIIAALCIATSCVAQRRYVIQHKPYIDLRPMHFGIAVGMNLQDIEFETEAPIVSDADRWNTGFSVGVLADMRLSNNLNLRIVPTMHFGAKHLTFLNMKQTDELGQPFRQTQDLKNTYVSLPFDLKFAAPRWNNHRPYIMAGINPMINLTGSESDIIRLKRYNTMLEVGIGCDFYLPFFKLIPELKFCFGLGNALDTNHVNELRDANLKAYAGSVSSAQSKMIVLTFYFE